MNEIYWKTKDGRVLNVDLMDDAHVRNAFKKVLAGNPSLQASKEDVQKVKDKFFASLVPEEIFGYDSSFNKITRSYCSVEAGDLYCLNKLLHE